MGQPDRLAIVTGTSSGLGRATATCLLRESWHVCGLARRKAVIDDPDYDHLQIDLSNLAETKARVRGRFPDGSVLSSYTRLALVNNAGTLGEVVSIPRLDPERLLASLALNVVAPAFLAGYLASLAGSRPLRIVDISSGAAAKAYPGWGAYCMGKAALRMAGMVLATEGGEVPALALSRISVVSFAPGVIDTPMQERVRASDPGEFPRLSRFVELKEDGALIPPEKPARRIAEILLDDSLPPFSEERFQG